VTTNKICEITWTTLSLAASYDISFTNAQWQMAKMMPVSASSELKLNIIII